jgi:GR25 family glycosyltransferase involved in LPS biosynthesis
MMCVYINLDEAIDRKESIQETFRCYADPAWKLIRQKAVNKTFVAQEAVPGVSSLSEKACFLSHRSAIQSQLDNDEHLLVLEDDALFGRSTAPLLGSIVNSALFDSFDMFFLSVIFRDPITALIMADSKKNLAAEQVLKIINLKGVPFYSTLAYVVNRKAKTKLFNLLGNLGEISSPVDDFYAQCVDEQKISAGAVFPFLAGQSCLGDRSQVREYAEDSRLLELSFLLTRAVCWADATEQDWMAYLREIKKIMGEELSAIGVAGAANVLASGRLVAARQK